MPLRPFPYPLSIGTDIVHVSRIRAILSKGQGKPGYVNSFLRRFLTPREHEAFAAEYQFDGSLNEHELDVTSKHLAGRWAAKEAAIKAVTWRRLSFCDIVILRAPDRRGLLAVITDRSFSRNSAGTSKVVAGDEFSSTNGSKVKTDSKLQHDRTDLDSSKTISGQLNSSQATSQHFQFSEERQTYHDEGTEGLSKDDELEDLSGQIVRVSISHDGDYATAVCLAAEEPAEGDVGGEAMAREATELRSWI